MNTFLIENKSNRTIAAPLLDIPHGSIERQQTTVSPEVTRHVFKHFPEHSMQTASHGVRVRIQCNIIKQTYTR